MLTLIRDLVQHKNHTNAALLNAIRQNEIAARDTELRTMLHHIILSNRFWITLILEAPFSVENESIVPDSLDEVADLYRDTESKETEWLLRMHEEELERQLESQYFTGHRYSVAQGLTQVCLHSHGHRAQIATRLRALGGTPPAMDFVMWLPGRAAPQWE
jgi:uncharacterized damage-inducible protein DinB